MKKPTRVTFLESHAGTESLFTRGLRSGAKAAGWDVDVVFLADEKGQPRSDKDVRTELLTKRPDTVCFLMDAPLHLERLWEAPSLAGVDKISLWFDDYYRSPKTLAHPEIWTAWQNNHGVRVGIWDAYWRLSWKMLTGVEAFPIHLAADPKLLTPGAPAWKPEWSDRAAFVGTIPSLKSLEAMSSHFPRALDRLLEDTCASMQVAPWPIRPYDLARACQSFLGSKYGLAIDAALQTPEIQAYWNLVLWRWGKRIARLRGLGAVGQGAPLAIMSGHGTEAYAGEEELRAALPKDVDFVYADTKGVASSSWKNLFQTGNFQVQITDPQSVEGGLPFRVFECAACGVPLLSDHRTELAELFPSPSGITTALNEAGLAEAAAKLRETPDKVLHAQGRDLRECFLDDHTWEVRWNQLAQRPQNLAYVASLATVSWIPGRYVEDIVPQAA
jgi:Glycosyl transferases group 1